MRTKRACLIGTSGEGLLGVVLVRVREVDFGDLMFPDPCLEDFRVAIGAGAVGKPVVKDSVAAFFERGGMMPHGRVEQSELLLVVADVASPGGGLDHADESILGRGAEERVIGEELIAEDPNEAHRGNLKHPRAGESKNGLFRSEVGKE